MDSAASGRIERATFVRQRSALVIPALVLLILSIGFALWMWLNPDIKPGTNTEWISGLIGLAVSLPSLALLVARLIVPVRVDMGPEAVRIRGVRETVLDSDQVASVALVSGGLAVRGQLLVVMLDGTEHRWAGPFVRVDTPAASDA